MMQAIIDGMPACRVGNGATDFFHACNIFNRHGSRLGAIITPYQPPDGGLILVQGSDGTTRGAAAITRHDKNTAEVQLVFHACGMGGLHYAHSLLAGATRLAKDLGYRFLITENLRDMKLHLQQGLLFLQHDFNPYPKRRRHAKYDFTLFMEKTL